jgi:hypothetical protein
LPPAGARLADTSAATGPRAFGAVRRVFRARAALGRQLGAERAGCQRTYTGYRAVQMPHTCNAGCALGSDSVPACRPQHVTPGAHRVQDKDKLPAPLKSLDLRSVFKSGIKEGEEANSPSQTDRIIQQTVGITSSPGGTPGDRLRDWDACARAHCQTDRR